MREAADRNSTAQAAFRSGSVLAATLLMLMIGESAQARKTTPDDYKQSSQSNMPGHSPTGSTTQPPPSGSKTDYDLSVNVPRLGLTDGSGLNVPKSDGVPVIKHKQEFNAHVKYTHKDKGACMPDGFSARITVRCSGTLKLDTTKSSVIDPPAGSWSEDIIGPFSIKASGKTREQCELGAEVLQKGVKCTDPNLWNNKNFTKFYLDP